MMESNLDAWIRIFVIRNDWNNIGLHVEYEQKYVLRPPIPHAEHVMFIIIGTRQNVILTLLIITKIMTNC